MSNSFSIPPGWYPAPHAANALRYWDGSNWGDAAPSAADALRCAHCGSAVTVDARFCARCGKPQQTAVAEMTITLTPQERRVPMGSLTNPEESATPVAVAADSAEALNARTPFDASVAPPQPGTLVPADCVWAFWPYPGPFPRNPNAVTKIDQKFISMGTLVGRHINEVLSAVGPAMVDISKDGLRSVVWGRTTFWSGSWQINLVFDSYGVCARVGQESNF